MRYILFLLILPTLLFAEVELKTEDDKVSYVYGRDIGQSLKLTPIDIKVDTLVRGIKDTLEGKDPLITDEDAAKIKQDMAARIRKQRQGEREKLAETNKAEGEKFLAANKKKDGWKATESGLQYTVVTEGKGAKPTADDTVEVHYRGTLINGEEFDSSYSRGQPSKFPLKSVIKGWTEGLQLMPEGSKYTFAIPSELAYGMRGGGAKIGPNATLLFDVELLKIVK